MSDVGQPTAPPPPESTSTPGEPPLSPEETLQLSIEERIEKVSALRARGKSRSVIAEILGVSLATVARDVARLKEEYLTRAMRSEGERVETEIDQVNLRRNELLAELAWSKEVSVKKIKRVGKVKTDPETGEKSFEVETVEEIEYKPTPTGDPEIRKELTELERAMVVLLKGRNQGFGQMSVPSDGDGSKQLGPGGVLMIPSAPPPQVPASLEPVDAVLVEPPKEG